MSYEDETYIIKKMLSNFEVIWSEIIRQKTNSDLVLISHFIVGNKITFPIQVSIKKSRLDYEYRQMLIEVNCDEMTLVKILDKCHLKFMKEISE